MYRSTGVYINDTLDQFFAFMSNESNLSNGRPPWSSKSSTVKVKQAKTDTEGVYLRSSAALCLK